MSKSTSNLSSIVFSFILLGFAGWYGWGHWQTLSETKTNVAQADTLLLTIEQDRGDLESDYEKERATFMQTVAEQAAKVEEVFPAEEDLPQLTRSFDEFAFSVQDLDGSDPFFISQLSYEEIKEADGYRVLPINMSLQTSERNLYKFLEYVETSGSLDPMVQLLSIESLSMQLDTEEEGALTVQLSLYAYFQTVSL